MFSIPLVDGVVPGRCTGTACLGKLHPELNTNGKLDKRVHGAAMLELRKRSTIQRFASVNNLSPTVLTSMVDMVKWEG